jgi:NitT/TauT family transport system substrate-binding protein
VPLAEVQLIEAAPPQMADRLKSGQLDAVAIFEPIASRIVTGGVGARSVDFFSEVNPDVVGSLWAATRGWATANAAAVSAFRAALADGQAFIAQNPERARQVEAKYLGFSGPRFPTLTLAIQPADLEFFVKIGGELGLVRKPIDTSRLILK